MHLGNYLQSSSRNLRPQKLLEGLAILSKLLDTLMELIKRHLVLEKFPTELGLVVDIANFGDGIGLGSCTESVVSSINVTECGKRTLRSIQLLGDGLSRVLEFLK